MQNVHFILNYSQSSKDEKNTHVKVTRRLRKFEKMSRKQGLLLKFENVTESRIRPIHVQGKSAQPRIL